MICYRFVDVRRLDDQRRQHANHVVPRRPGQQSTRAKRRHQLPVLHLVALQAQQQADAANFLEHAGKSATILSSSALSTAPICDT